MDRTAPTHVPTEQLELVDAAAGGASSGDPSRGWPLGSALSLILMGPLLGAGAPHDPGEEARLRGQCGDLTAMLRRGVDTLLNVGGAGSFASANVLQRHWRDIDAGSRHAFLATNVCLETYGRNLFGLDPVVAIV